MRSVMKCFKKMLNGETIFRLKKDCEKIVLLCYYVEHSVEYDIGSAYGVCIH